MATRYEAKGIEAEFEPASRRRVLRNKLGIVRVQDMQEAESEALLAVEDWAVQHFAVTHRFTTKDLRDLHRQWLGDIYSWAGQYRTVNLGKGNFSFAAAAQVPRLMAGFERKELTHHTPCEGMGQNQLISALARTHGEFVLIHPFREGNGRCGRLLALLMALQAGLPPLDFAPLAGRGKAAYIAAIQAVVGGDYKPLEARFAAVIRRTLKYLGPLQR